ncbi:alkene reductase [Nocardioides speluncae]|uniref:alkene reductase n=1 Tax=Nocardioides speluncae TaxID=2670337 RepID=UPI000D68BD43|nr:alkene reductase [Nocardioides speluncae]
MSRLFEPVSVGKLTLPNRLVMSPMTRNRATAEGHATALMADYYSQRAGAGLIITEGIQPSVIGQGYVDTPGLHDDDQVDSWRQVTDAVHSAGGRIVAQLMHTGRIGHPAFYPDGMHPVAPSAVRADQQTFTGTEMLDLVEPRELTVAEIAETVADFANAARNAIAAGFDGIEIHGANGYLVQQFLSTNTNLRTDEYGGSVANRIRFAVEVTRAIADAIGPERTGLRISPGNTYNSISETETLETYVALVRELPNIAYVHIMESANRDVTARLREEWSGALILNPHPTPDSFPATTDAAEQAVADGVADATSLGQAFLANPDLHERVRAGGPFNEADPETFYGGDHRGYTDYPAL